MTPVAKVASIVACTIAALVFGAFVYINFGFYNIGADDHHTKMTLTIIERLRDRSIAVRARATDVPNLEEPTRIAAGAEYYAMLCVGCHLAPGVTKSTVRLGLYPHPPNLAEEDIHDAQRAFWTVKHGIKMSAMPAWEKTLDDPAIWDVVAFVRQMPAMTPETYEQLSKRHSS